MLWRKTLTILCLAPCGVVAWGTSVSAEEAVDFGQDVRPILSNHCFVCHGPDEADRQTDMRLDVPGEADLDELVARITSSDPDLMMPPPDAHKPLRADQIATLRRWVEAGGVHEQHWAYLPPQPVEPPNPGVGDAAIDRFVAVELERRGRTPSARADRRTLIRRVTQDLTGLAPTQEEIRQFLADESPDAYQRLVERLLERPQYGEQMARYWLDLVRFADTNGLHHDHYREMTPYRDWVIRSFNDNLPYDEFITYQLAGDLLENPTTDQQIATGFNRLHLIIDVGTALPEESFHRNVVDRVAAFGTAMLGLTLECAVCHDHKYDPITQQDFYQLYAFFNNFDGEPETGGRGTLDFRRGLQPPYLELPTPEQAAALEKIDGQLAELEEQRQAARSQVSQEVSSAKAGAIADSRADSGEDPSEDPLESLAAEIESLAKQREELLEQIPAALVMKERDEIRPTHLLIRGAYDQPGKPVERDTPAFLPALSADDGPPTRRHLANWLVDRDHPLTARVAVNRFWQQFFGTGLVKTAEDFGAQGAAPSHPKLLDYLALRFIDSGWDIKGLIREIVLSETYCQSSHASPEAYLDDPENRLLSRGSRFRLSAEAIRDQALAVSGLLNETMYGKSVKIPQPPGLWKHVSMPTSNPYLFEADTGAAIYRRSIYSFWKRGFPPPQLTIFDAPNRESCIARRERTNTPLQALVLMNEGQFVQAARHFAQQLYAAPESDEEKIRRAYEIITSHLPSRAAMVALEEGLRSFRSHYARDREAAIALVGADLQSQLQAPVEQPEEWAAWTMVVHTLLNLDSVKTRQ